MTRRKVQSGQILIILLGSLFFGGSAIVVGTLGTGHSLEELKSRITHVVKDAERERTLKGALDGWEKAGKEYEKATAESQKDIVKLAHRRDATRAEFQAAYGEIDARDARFLERFVGIRESIKKQVTSEEWQAIFK
jgi:predicted  nucleic acid-binding Zn-ribbon protein